MVGVNINTIYIDENGNKVYVMALAEYTENCNYLVIYHDFTFERLTYAMPDKQFSLKFKECD